MSFTLYNYVLSGNCYKVRLLASLLNVSHDTIAVEFFSAYRDAGHTGMDSQSI